MPAIIVCSSVPFLLGAYGYVHKGKAKGLSQDDVVFPIAAKIMKGKNICCFLPQSASSQ